MNTKKYQIYQQFKKLIPKDTKIPIDIKIPWYQNTKRYKNTERCTNTITTKIPNDINSKRYKIPNDIKIEKNIKYQKI